MWLRMDRIAAALAGRGIAVSQAYTYATTWHASHALRLGLASNRAGAAAARALESTPDA